MPKQALLRLIKRWRRYVKRGDWESVPPLTRGIYVLYYREPEPNRTRPSGTQYKVAYIGIAGTGKNVKSGVRGRLRSHDKNRSDWTHYSFFEVHDNVGREEIREIEALLLAIFRHDPRIGLENKRRGSLALRTLRGAAHWSPERR